MQYSYTVTKVWRREGGYQSKTLYEVKCAYFVAEIVKYGNQGFDAPTVRRTSTESTYFDALNTFMRAFYSGKLYEYFILKEGETKSFELERYF